MTDVERTVMFTMPNLLSGRVACIAGTTAGRSWELGAGTFTIGRLDEHDLCLANEPGVSKTHAKIVAHGDQYQLVDCESRNGTILNGTSIQKADLYDGDEIRICGCVLRFQQSGGPKRPRRPSPTRAPTAVDDPSLSPAATHPPEDATGTFLPPAAQPAAAATWAPQPPAAAAWAPQPPPQGSVGRALARWYAAGFAVTVVLGGAAAAAVALTTPAPLDAAAGPVPAVASAGAATSAGLAAEGGAVASGPEPAVGASGGALASGTPALPTPAEPTPAEPTPAAPTPAAPTPAEPTPAEPTPAEPTPAAATGAVAAAAVDGAAPVDATSGPASATRDRPAPTTMSSTADVPTSARFAAIVDGGAFETVKTKTGGRVATVDVVDGASVIRGQRLVTFDTGGDPGEIQTLHDRIASLENADDEEAKRDLKAAKQRLAALEGGRGASPIVAGSDGKLTGFNVTVGAVLKPGEVVGRIGDAEAPTRVRVTVSRGLRVKNGQDATLVLKSGGTAPGTIVSVTGRTVVIDTGAVAGDAVEAVEF